LQETTLFTGTIRNNIAFGKPNASMDEVIAVAQAAAAHEFIMEFPQGYDTPVGERGSTLSGGQKQRIAIARALLLDPRILILDDSTSSVDLTTEFKIQQALDKLMKGARRSSSHSALARCSTLIKSWCWTRAKSSRAAHTKNCSNHRKFTRRFTHPVDR